MASLASLRSWRLKESQIPYKNKAISTHHSFSSYPCQNLVKSRKCASPQLSLRNSSNRGTKTISRYHSNQFRQYSTDSSEEEASKPESTTQPETELSKLGLTPESADFLSQTSTHSGLPVLSEEEKEFVRHKQRPDGKYEFPPSFMINLHYRRRKHVVVAGGGYLASALTLALMARGHGVSTITRESHPGWPFSYQNASQWWDVTSGRGVPDCDALVQLTGSKYLDQHVIPNDHYNKQHFDSRGGITELLAHHLPRTKFPPKVFIQASHAGIYPASDTSIYTESYKGPYSTDLIGKVSEHYEQKSQLIKDQGIRTVQMRIGHVIGDYGILQNNYCIDEKGRAWWTSMGSGQQWFPWIHISDVCDLIVEAIVNESIEGPVNAVAPQAVRQEEVGKNISELVGRNKLKIPMPETAANWLYPKRAHFLLEGRHLSPEVALQHKFEYKYPNLKDAMLSICDRLVPVQWIHPGEIHIKGK